MASRKHNKLPSLAVDFLPYPKPERNEKLWAALAYVAGRIIEMAKQDGVEIRWGGDWNRNGDLTDQNFDDLFHLELVLPDVAHEKHALRPPSVPAPRSLG